MELYLFRHGEAEPVGVGGDEPRTLRDKGRSDVLAMAGSLLRAGVRPDAIYMSPLVRARQTGRILRDTFGVPAEADERLRPGATLGAIQSLLRERGGQRVVLVGHEPDLSAIIVQLTGGRVRMRTAGIARVDLDRVESGGGILIWLASPDMLAAT